MIAKKNIFSLLLFLLFAMCNCNTTVGPDKNIVFPDEGEVSFQNNVLPFLKVKCALSGCHDGYNPKASDMTDYFKLFETDNVGLIVQGNPDGSVLVQVIEGTNHHLDYYKINITDNQKQGIRRWIQDGALNN